MAARPPSPAPPFEPLVIARAALEAMERHARQCEPEECCGLLLGSSARIDSVRPAANVATDRQRRFEIDPQLLIDAYRAERSWGQTIRGYYHSHPTGLAVPSPTDSAQASGDGRVWAIVGARDVTFWRDEETGFVRLSYVIDDG